MSRDFYINGETLVLVKGRSDCGIAALSELGLADSPVRISFDFHHADMNVDAWGTDIPVDVQWMLLGANITMNLIHFDKNILDVVVQLSMGADPVNNNGSLTQMGRAGQRLGNNQPRFGPAVGNPGTGYQAGNNYIGLNLTSPVLGKPFCFFYTYLTGNPYELPLGTEKSVVPLNFRAIPYTQDPYQGGLGAYNQQLFSHTLDT